MGIGEPVREPAAVADLRIKETFDCKPYCSESFFLDGFLRLKQVAMN